MKNPQVFKFGLLSLLLVVFLGVFTFQGAKAQLLDPVCEDNPDATVCQDNTDQNVGGNDLYGPDGILTKAARIISFIVGIASVIVIIVGGLQLMTSGGDPGKAASARNAVLYAAVGLVVTALSQVIIIFILSRL